MAKLDTELQIFASDIDEDALTTARRGIYPESAVADVSAERLRRFFTRTDDQTYQVNKRLRDAIVFAPQNLIGDAPFSKLDLISCRNLLIYLEPEVQKNVISLFHFALNEGGCLMLGPSETVGRQTNLFEVDLGTVADLQANRPDAAARGRDPDRRRSFVAAGTAAEHRRRAGHIAGTRRTDAEATAGRVRAGVGADQPQVRGALFPGPHGRLSGIPQRRAHPRPAGPGPARPAGPAAGPGRPGDPNRRSGHRSGPRVKRRRPLFSLLGSPSGRSTSPRNPAICCWSSSRTASEPLRSWPPRRDLDRKNPR